ncbi:MAG TPA: isochorismatase family protein [Egibacteraceae bacterium]|nr:isochorismatase family protein [Egibacteraceae bacterium]
MPVLTGAERAVGRVPGSDPYPWPYDGDLEPARMALVVAGASSAWRSRCPDLAIAERNIGLLSGAMRSAGAVVVTVHQGVPARAGFFGEEGEPLVLRGARRVHAAGLDAFYGGPLEPALRALGRDLLVLAGYGLEGPVHSTLRGANDRGLECLLVTDACTSTDQGLRDAAARTVTMSGGIFGAVGDTASVCAALEARKDALR